MFSVAIVDNFISCSEKLKTAKDEYKKIEKEHKELKEKILECLETQGLKETTGTYKKLVVTSKNITYIDFKKVQSLFRKEKLTNRLPDVVKVVKSALERIVSKEKVDSISKVITNEYDNLKIV